MERRRSTREFELEAVRLTNERGFSYAQASDDLGFTRRNCATGEEVCGRCATRLSRAW